MSTNRLFFFTWLDALTFTFFVMICFVPLCDAVHCGCLKLDDCLILFLNYGYTLPETNISRETRSLEKEIPIGNHHFWGLLLLVSGSVNL